MTEPKKKTGRPQFQPTDDQRKKVKVMVMAGHSEDTIAEALKISRWTLRRRFPKEIANGHALVEGEMLMKLYEQAENGKVVAIKALLDRSALARMAPPEVKERQPRVRPKGKKEVEQEAAHTPDESTEMGRLLAAQMAGNA